MHEVDTAALIQAWESGAPVLDVREDYEYIQGHVPGAQLIPLPELSARVSEVAPGETVYVICASGNRSKRGAEILESAGRPAVSVAGGTRAWVSAGREVRRGPTA
ncbi:MULTISPECIES: rhodanese-like domain-containing protein [Rhodococcus]|uniref:rhodanese-like domain-containing protein n=1 Tax=Rhodococcus TaxID=1827 RepID=UPI000575A687|nr:MULTISPECIES: rhodanese-like domain-containing protein [Rhodococcus]APE11960.1 sulfurtransferase [Rhodococcus sp. 2G]AYA27781.1 rhodanese-like domain-containing protein [Rhodococcus rhodochrous]KHJ70495.1 sulfurtransferase [Rhodococcus sp. Chr-9]MCD2098299.1 rhodanese-like domain-containing protein [Rhodococcus rhodochrous]MCD2122432.1 rhodanese-like domain-containing protein [Rhodococcus rhodochrous]